MGKPAGGSPTARDPAQRILDELTATVDYFRIQTSRDSGGERTWFSCEELLADPAALVSLVRSTAPGRGTDDDAVAMSLFVQGYAYRIASTAIGSFVISGDVVSVDPAQTSVAIGRHRPNAVHLGEAALVAARGDLAVLHRVLVDGHLAALVDAAHTAVRIGRPLLWANVGSSCAASFGAFVDPLAHDAQRIRAMVEGFFVAARDELAQSGRVARIGHGAGWAWERGACCLWYRTTTSGGANCGDCSLWTDAERSARYAEAAEQH
ncbi:MAG: hypothetical protein OXF04_10660 [bacterium]|nr:hypothetical protein [bacterium]